jgi:actin-like ATPase involved in cell morphogenesis
MIVVTATIVVMIAEMTEETIAVITVGATTALETVMVTVDAIGEDVVTTVAAYTASTCVHIMMS